MTNLYDDVLTADQRSKANLQRLTDKHIQRYGRMLDAAAQGQPGYRKGELIGLIVIWKSVQRARFNWDALDDHARREVYDAILSEE